MAFAASKLPSTAQLSQVLAGLTVGAGALNLNPSCQPGRKGKAPDFAERGPAPGRRSEGQCRHCSHPRVGAPGALRFILGRRQGLTSRQQPRALAGREGEAEQ